MVCTSPTLSGISTLNQDEVKTLWGLSFRLNNGIGIWHSLYTVPAVIVPTAWCAPLQHFQVFLLLASRWCQLSLGVSAQTDSGIRNWHSLYTLPEVIVPISGVQLSNTFRYIYS